MSRRMRGMVAGGWPGVQNNEAREDTHANDVVPRDLVSPNIDYRQMGVGGDDFWGKRTLMR